MSKNRKRALAIAAAAAVVLTGAGVAYGLWSASGTGSGIASSRTAQSLVVTAALTGSNDLYPSASATGKLSLKIQNPNPYQVTVSSLSADANGVAQAPSTCSFKASYAGEAGLSIVVAPGATVAYTSPVNTVTLPLAADDPCQNTSFLFSNITATGSQS
jgi:hypothetical protein